MEQTTTARHLALLALLFIAITAAAYSPAWNGKPIWDDDAHLTRPSLRSLAGLQQIWIQPGSTRQYYPVAHSVFWLEHTLWGDSPLPYHVVNILLHAASAVLLFRILLLLGIPGAWLAAGIFALHPVQVESVAWISELKNTLSGFFFLSSLLAYLRFDQTKKQSLYFISLGLFLLGLMSKSVIATLPAVLLIVFWWQRGRISWKRDVARLVPFFLVGIGAGLFTAWVELHLIGAQGKAFDLSLLDRGLIAGRVFWFYLAKLFWPATLTFIYPRWEINSAVWWQWLFPLALILLLAALWMIRKRSRAPLAAALLFLGMLFPVLGFLNVYPFRYSFVADHFQYLASIPVFTLFAAGLTLFFDRWKNGGRAPAYILPASILAVLAFLTWRQAHIYVDAETVYQATLKDNPDCWLALDNLGLIRFEQEKVPEAIALYERALKIHPDSEEIYTNLGNAYLVQGRVADAIAQYEKTLQLSPQAIPTLNNLAWLLATSPDVALRNGNRALELAAQAVELSREEDPVMLRTLAAAFAETEQFPQAAAAARIALEVAGDNPAWVTEVRKELSRYQAGLPRK